MAQVAMVSAREFFLQSRALRLGALLLAVVLIGFSPRCALAATPGFGTVNIAQGKPVTPLTGTVLGSVSGVNDGTSAGYWYSYDSTSCTALQICATDDGHTWHYSSFIVDLQDVYAIGRISISPNQTRGFKVYSSDNGTDWTEQLSFDAYDNTGALTSSIGPITFEPKGVFSARYLKYVGWAWWVQYVGMSEFQVYEWQADSAPLPSIGSLTDLAAGKQAGNSGGSVTAGQDAYPNLTDGDLFTYWQPVYYFDNCQYIYSESVCPLNTWYNNFGSAYVDLGASVPIQAIRLTFPPGLPGAQSYVVDISDAADNATNKWWTFGGDLKVVASYPPVTSSATQTFYLPSAINARYVWVTLENWTTNQPLLPNLAEIEVYGELSPSSSYTIKAAAGANGTISPAGTVSVNSGANQAFAITPDPGFHVENVSVDGVSVGSVTSYTFTAVAADHNITATFTGGAITKTTPAVMVAPAASSITALQSLSVTVSVSGGESKPAPTGTVTLVSGSFTSGATSLMGGQATIVIPAGALAVGADTLTADYAPDAGSTEFNPATGSAVVTVTVPPPVATLSASSLNFSAVVGATSAAQVVQLSNTGGTALNISSVSIAGTGSAAFAETTTCGSTLAPGASCAISITFAPTAGLTYAAELNVVDNASGSPHTVNLSGGGVTFKVSAAPTSILLNLTQTLVTTVVTVSSQNGTFPNAVALTVDGVPSNVSAYFLPTSVQPHDTAAASTLVLQMVNTNYSLKGLKPLVPMGFPVFAIVGLFAVPRKLRRRWLTVLLLVFASWGAIGGITGCASFKTPLVTPGSYALTVTATSGKIQQTTTIQLVMK